MGPVAVLVPGVAWAGSIEIDRGVVGAPGDSVTQPPALENTAAIFKDKAD